jgi:hypothetical protein
MKIQEFVDEALKVTNDSIREKRINSMLKTKSYVSIVDKINLADRVTKAATHEFDKDGNIVEFKVNSLTKYILHVMGIIEMYTDLEVNNGNILAEYDLLNENGLIEIIVKSIKEQEIAECQMCLDMVFNDAIQNEMSTVAFVKRQVDRFGTLVGTTLSPAINGFAEAISNLDNEKIQQIISMVEKEKE